MVVLLPLLFDFSKMAIRLKKSSLATKTKDTAASPDGIQVCGFTNDAAGETLHFLSNENETAKTAKDGGFDYFATTLTVSPHKNAELINGIGERLAKEIGVNWLYADFKKEEGYKRSIEISKEYEIYRQRYCGCLYSKYAHIKTEEES